MRDEKNTDGTGAPRPDQPRAPYRRPQLHVYGDLAAVTKAIGNTGKNDQQKGNRKTG